MKKARFVARKEIKVINGTGTDKDLRALDGIYDTGWCEYADETTAVQAADFCWDKLEKERTDAGKFTSATLYFEKGTTWE